MFANNNYAKVWKIFPKEKNGEKRYGMNWAWISIKKYLVLLEFLILTRALMKCSKLL